MDCSLPGSSVHGLLQARILEQVAILHQGIFLTQVQSLGREDLQEGMATHSSILAWRSPWTEEPGGLQSTGSQRVRHDSSDLAHTHAGEKKG